MIKLLFLVASSIQEMFYKTATFLVKFNAMNAYPDQIPHFATSDLGLHCKQKSLCGAYICKTVP